MPRKPLSHQKPCYRCGEPIEFVGRTPVQPGYVVIEIGGEGERDEVLTDDGDLLVGALRPGCSGYRNTPDGLRVTMGRRTHSRFCNHPANPGRFRADYLGPRDWARREKQKQLSLLGEE